MKLIKMFGLAATAAVAAMAFVGATSVSASVNSQLCKTHTGLLCEEGQAQTTSHMVLKGGTVGQLLAAIDVLCLGFLALSTPLALGKPQLVHSLEQKYEGCGTGSTHNNCTVTIPEGQQPLFDLLKTGLDGGGLRAESGQTRLVCSNLGLNCLYDLEGMEFSVGAGHLTAEETGVTELGGKFLCPDEGKLDALLEALPKEYLLG